MTCNSFSRASRPAVGAASSFLLMAVSALAIGSFAAPPADADTGFMSVPLVPPKPADIVGTWLYSTGQPSVSGRCPAGFPIQGELVISYDSSAPTTPYDVMEGPIALDIVSGSVCKPASLCHLRGIIDRTLVAVGASAIVDDEGGRAVVGWSLAFQGSDSAEGEATSNYSHPSGFSCDWAMDVRLTRPKE